MALESATYINQLVATNPTLADPKGQGDDHLRMIKSVLQSSFPNFTGAMTASQAQLNVLTDQTVLFKPGMILLWYGAIANIPAGWLLCNGVGTTSTGGAIPNLTDRFVVGAGAGFAPGNSGGSATHTHAITVAGTALTLAQMPPHTHNVQYWRSNGADYQGVPGSATDLDASFTAATQSAGSGDQHTHTASSAGPSVGLPPYYALAYIVKF